MYEKTLPIGSVVLLKNGNKRAMIIGYYQKMVGNQDKIYDYVGVGFPEGFIKSDALALFDHEQIETVYSIGFQDNEWSDFQNRLLSAIQVSNGDN